ncbi:MAG: NFACT family protein [Lachnospiraceae bacterium]|nr:NFACT family protein [Lachnospiraceae bacterium]
MAFDGIVIANLAKELNDLLAGGRIQKVAQPEKDELILTIKQYDVYKLFLSADASLPLVYLTDSTKPSPLTAPNFCMLLRKHFNSARIISITQPGLERSLDIKIEHLDEIGDLKVKHLIIEIMGKHSNIILCDENYVIVDSIKHISGFVSSVREVLPGRSYFLPQTVEKANPLTLTLEELQQFVLSRPLPLAKALYTGLTGISPVMAEELCHRAGLSSDHPANTLSEDYGLHLFKVLERFAEGIKEGTFSPCIIFKEDAPVEFSAVPLTCYEDHPSGTMEIQKYDSISTVLEEYYAKKNQITRIRQKSADLRRIVNTAIEREAKKYDLQTRQLKDTEKREKYKVYGELITAYGYGVEPGSKSMQALNYYTNEEISIPLDETISPMENAKKYFEKYNKLKRTYEALSVYIQETKEALDYMESVRLSLDLALTEDDLNAIKEELIESGYLRRHIEKGSKKKPQKVKLKNTPLHYLSSDGYHLYVGKNNLQNDELTFHFAANSDWWFHAKGIPGSHVILKTGSTDAGTELPDRVYEEAAALAAYYSKGRDNDKVEIDYVEKKQVKKPAGGKPGFVVYYTNYSMMASPDISALKLLED